MQTLTLQPAPSDHRVLRCRPAYVYVDGRRRHDLAVSSWEVLPGPEFGRAVLVLRPSRLAAIRAGIEAGGRLPPVGSRVLIRPAPGSGGGELWGIVAVHRAEVRDDGEALGAGVDHELAHVLAAAVAGTWRAADGAAVAVPEGRIRFNAGEGTLASAAAVDISGRAVRVFAAGPPAKRWSAADTINYLIATGVPAGIVCPSTEEIDALAAEIDLGTLDVTHLSVGEALAETTRRAGLAMRAARYGLGLVFYRPGRDGRRTAVKLQLARQRLSLGRTNLLRGRVEIRRRPCRPAVLAIGPRKQYECTFELSPGWDPYTATSRWRDVVRTTSSDWPRFANVYRKWVLNEDGRYGQDPWNLEVHDFSPISADDFFLPAARRLLPCISADEAGASLGIVVEYRPASGESWRRWPGPVYVGNDECAIRLGGDALPADYYQAAVDQTVAVRVTAVVEADARLTAEVPGDAGVRREVLDMSARAAWRRLHSGSIFHGDGAIGAADERDDTAMLEAAARRCAESAGSAVDAEVTLGWIDTTCGVGDLVERIDGRTVELSGSPGRAPAITAVRHDFGDGQTTTLTVSG